MNLAQRPIGVWCPSSSLAPCAFGHWGTGRNPNDHRVFRRSNCSVGRREWYWDFNFLV